MSILSLEAAISLIIMVSIFTLSLDSVLTAQRDGDAMNRVVLHRQASDFLNVIMNDGSLEKENVEHMEKILNALDSDAMASVEVEGKDGNVMMGERCETPGMEIKVERTMVTKSVEFRKVTLLYAKC